MANVVKHPFVSAVADGGDATKVRPSNWNAAHVFAGGSNNDDILVWKSDEADKAAWKSLVTLLLTLLTTKGDTAVRTASTVVREAVGADGTVLIADSTQTTGRRWGVPSVTAPSVPITGLWSARTFSGGPNGVAPLTTYDLSAAAVALYKPADHGTVVRRGAPTLTTSVNTATAGPVVNGRDQAGAFSNSSWVHFYWIWNGTSLAGVASAVPPPVGPTTVTGYDWWSYAGAAYKNSAGNLVPTLWRGDQAFYLAEQVLATGAGITSEELIPLGTVIPPNALAIRIGTEVYSALTPAIRVVTGIDFWTAPNNIITGAVITTLDVPNVGAQLIYFQSGSNSRRLVCLGFTMPNGAS